MVCRRMAVYTHLVCHSLAAQQVVRHENTTVSNKHCKRSVYTACSNVSSRYSQDNAALDYGYAKRCDMRPRGRAQKELEVRCTYLMEHGIS